MKALILSGGKGNRLRPITYTSAKQLVPVANKPVLFYAIESLIDAGITDIGIVVGQTKDEVMAAVGDGSRWGAKVTYIEQAEPLGLAHAVLISEPFIGTDKFVLFLGDNFLRGGIRSFVDQFADEIATDPANALIILTKVANPSEMGVAVLDGDRIVRLVEKPKVPPSDLAIVGIYLFDSNIFDAARAIKPSWRNELEITDAIQYLVDNKLDVRAQVITDRWIDTGKKDDMLVVNRVILADLKRRVDGTVSENSEIVGEVVIEAGAEIVDSVIRGPAIIGANSRIVNSYVGPFTSVYHDVIIENSEIENSIVLEKGGNPRHTGPARCQPDRTRGAHQAFATPAQRLYPVVGRPFASGVDVKLLVTGGCGFIGSNFVHYVPTQHPADVVTVLDKLTYAGNPANLEDLGEQVTLVKGDIADSAVVKKLTADVDAIVNFAAETHVDRSLLDDDDFIRTNVQGTQTLLKAALARGGMRYLQVSTDEVYGAILSGHSKETDRLDPRSPYSAAKAGGDLLVSAYFESYGLDAVITRGANTIGPRQYPEKVVPLFVTNALDNQPLPIYGDGGALRDYIYVEDHCAAIDLVLRSGKAGEIYNVGATRLLNTIQVADMVLGVLDKPSSLKRFVEDRPGHDRRYSVDSSKLRALGWAPQCSLDDTFERTVTWYRDHEQWWRPIKSGEFAAYYERQYGRRLAATAE